MPSKPFSIGKRSFYLDQSTLSDAYRSLSLIPGDGDRAYAPLVNWIQQIAEKANLCLSLLHVYEIAGWDPVNADGLAQWLDRLPVVWVHSSSDVVRREFDELLRGQVGLVQRSAEPFSASYLSLFPGINPEGIAEGLERASLPQVVRDVRRMAPDNYWGNNSNRWSTKIHDNRQNQNALQVQREVAKNKSDGFLNDIRSAHERLMSKDREYAAQYKGQVMPFAERPWSIGDCSTLRCYRVLSLLHDGFVSRSVERQPGSKKFKALGSSPLDIEHAAVPAAYCDVLTCDKLTSSWLGDYRQGSGLARQMVRGEFSSTEEFVVSLMTTWP